MTFRATLFVILAVLAQCACAEIPSEFTVGVKISEPFVSVEGTCVDGPNVKVCGNSFVGDAIDVWEGAYPGASNYVSFPTVDALLDAVQRGDVDVAVGAISITSDRELNVDFTHPFHQTGLTYATMGDESTLSVFMSVLPTLAYGIGVILAVMAVAGAIFAILEHKANEGVASRLGSIFTGIYWSSATITTVGYGDVSAQTPAGRFFSTVWMWSGLIIASMLTSLIVSAVNVNTAGIQEFNPLRSDIAVVQGSAGLHYVENLVQSRNIHEFETLQEAVEAVVSGRVDAVVHDEALLNHMAGEFDGLFVSAETFNSDFYAFAVPEDSQYLEQLNVLMLQQQ